MVRRKGEASSKRTGLYYETQAAVFLEKQGYQILERNFRCPAGEIDLIAKEGGYLCFVEVKYRSERETGTPEEAVDAKKQKRISRAALYYLMKQGLGDTTPCRFDVVGIRPDGIRVTKNAFSFKR
ncbi:MAG TPA: YraN family protein [Candidatus Blautia pullistercoris]|uniref:UPF0102 protein H9738_06580 n=2 Tax=Blautia TaxID=572511 RepID=A0A9D2AMF2_9FIRM|nr:YraN family protein [Candidatus Blautia stercorigallinarum]HIX37521.1 YraN family protein [Candidatus Blautia pullistercoris]